MGIFLFLDFDGTLAPIASTPEKAALSAGMRRLLEGLSIVPHVRLAVISGRSLVDIKAKVGIKGIIYAGNHGLEMEGPGFKYKAPVKKGALKSAAAIREILNERLSGFKGVLIENKGLVTSVHYRKADASDIPKLTRAFRKALNPFLERKAVSLGKGKMVFEVKPRVDWDKGRAVLWLLSKFRRDFVEKRPLAVYIGDDITDEDAFRALKKRGFTLKVGKVHRTNAHCRLNDTRQVYAFLRNILNEYAG